MSPTFKFLIAFSGTNHVYLAEYENFFILQH